MSNKTVTSAINDLIEKGRVLTKREVIGYFIRDGRFQVAEIPDGIQLFRVFNKRPVSIILEKRTDGYWLSMPRYAFKCRNSFYDYFEDENRVTRSKDTIIFILEHLRSITPVWKCILNKKFVSVNANNTRVQKNDSLKLRLNKELENLIA